jgi:hypothetical protein
VVRIESTFCFCSRTRKTGNKIAAAGMKPAAAGFFGAWRAEELPTLLPW